MVGIFSRISGGWGHRRAQSAMDLREQIPPSVEGGGSVSASGGHGIDIALEFKPVEHPTEPLIHDQPITCPLPEPSILNDGRLWKERISSATARARTELPVVTEGINLHPQDGTKSQPYRPKRHIASSYSAPEHNIVALLEECNASENQTDN